MTELTDFLGQIHGRWLEKNIRDGFGSAALNSDITFIARVLEVKDTDMSPEEAEKAGAEGLGDVALYKYAIRCRILSVDNHGVIDGRLPLSRTLEIDTIANPDAMLPDPCDKLNKPEANAAIQRHPWYTPLNDKLKKPFKGDFVKVKRMVAESPGEAWAVGTYMGFLIQTPALDLPPPPSRRGGFGSSRPGSYAKPKSEAKAPIQYIVGQNATKLAKVAKVAAQAINNWGAVTKVKSGAPRKKPKWADYDPATRGNIDPRLPTEMMVKPKLTPEQEAAQDAAEAAEANRIAGGDITTDPALGDQLPKRFTGNDAGLYGIPESWYTPSHPEFKSMVKFIKDVSDGYPGMPNGISRKYLVNTQLREALTAAPSPATMATEEKYWKLWWHGIATWKRSPIGGLFRSLANTGTTTGGKVRFGLGSFHISTADKYFPTQKKKFPFGEIKYGGIAGIGDVYCEMYALMMFIKINFGSPLQFNHLMYQAFLSESKGVPVNVCKNNIVKCKKQGGAVFVGGPPPPAGRGYRMNNTIMPRGSPYKCGMCEQYPLEEEL